MNLFKTVFSICFQNIRKWGKDYRIWSVAVLVVVMINIYINDLQEICSKLYNEPINQDKKLKKISDLDIMKIRKKKKRRSKLWESEQHIQQSTRAK